MGRNIEAKQVIVNVKDILEKKEVKQKTMFEKIKKLPKRKALGLIYKNNHQAYNMCAFFKRNKFNSITKQKGKKRIVYVWNK